MYVIKINNKYYWCTVPSPFSPDIRRAVIYRSVKQAESVVRDLSGRMRYICGTKYNNNRLPDDMKEIYTKRRNIQYYFNFSKQN